MPVDAVLNIAVPETGKHKTIRYRRPCTCGPVMTTARRARRTHPDTATASPATQVAPAAQRYALTGEGHEWPGGPAMPSAITSALGPQSDAVSANALMWDFFRAHLLR